MKSQEQILKLHEKSTTKSMWGENVVAQSRQWNAMKDFLPFLESEASAIKLECSFIWCFNPKSKHCKKAFCYLDDFAHFPHNVFLFSASISLLIAVKIASKSLALASAQTILVQESSI